MKILHPLRTLAAAALLCAGVAASTAASAASVCLPAAEADTELRDKYDEAPIGHGVAAGRLVLLYTAADGSSWTVTVLDPRSGLMCILAAGESWEELPRPRRPPNGTPS